ncbi:response regulator [Kriegella aquimaris]|uniref:Response regulator receiver domain-containing protein n=1 Tax=Kriegella aquimaris TaxID=192904 RepID=A0A1G9IT57_9FLAO|nr:response regulator [Kriegella aquimaris]SDL28387.1 Response regulator receiver domain-containing protein [Kriegella aquimaris]
MKNPLHVCIVDDDEIYKYALMKSVKPLLEGSEVTLFSNGEDTLSYILENQNDIIALPDIILLDIDMPVMDGFQFLEEYESIEHVLAKKITIYMVSSSVDPEDLKRAKSFDTVTDYISKPLREDKFKNLINAL